MDLWGRQQNKLLLEYLNPGDVGFDTGARKGVNNWQDYSKLTFRVARLNCLL
jgi:hypothetical protein